MLISIPSHATGQILYGAQKDVNKFLISVDKLYLNALSSGDVVLNMTDMPVKIQKSQLMSLTQNIGQVDSTKMIISSIPSCAKYSDVYTKINFGDCFYNLDSFEVQVINLISMKP